MPRASGPPMMPRDDREAMSVQVRLFDADRQDRALDLAALESLRLHERQLLWLDGTGEWSDGDEGSRAAADDQRAGLAAALQPLDVQAATIAQLGRGTDRPRVELHGAPFVLRLPLLAGEAARPGPPDWLDIVAGRNFVLTLHPRALSFLDDVDRSIERDTPVGELDSAAFVAILLDALLTSYLGIVDGLEDDIDRLDGLALRRVRPDLLGEVVQVRRRIAAVRRVLIAQRPVFAALARADFEAVATDEPRDARRFQALEERFEGVLAAIEGARELLLGTFEIHMAQTAQRTNEIMKVLALASVLLLPGALIAGVMGMNFKAPLSSTTRPTSTSWWRRSVSSRSSPLSSRGSGAGSERGSCKATATVLRGPATRL